MLIPFDTQPRGTPVLITYEGPNGERYEYHAVEESGGYEAEFHRCRAGWCGEPLTAFNTSEPGVCNRCACDGVLGEGDGLKQDHRDCRGVSRG